MKKTKATTLVEIVFYFALVAIFLGAAMNFAVQITESYGVSQTLNELQSNVDFMTERLTISLGQATSVDTNNSLLDVDEGQLTLIMAESPSPVVFYVSQGDFFIQEGSGTSIQLNTTAVQVDQMRFHVSTHEKAPDQVTIDGSFSLAGAEASAYQNARSFHLFIALKNF